MSPRTSFFKAAAALTALFTAAALALPVEAGSASRTRRSVARSGTVQVHHGAHHHGRLGIGLHFGTWGYGYYPWHYGYGVYYAPGYRYGPRHPYAYPDGREPHGALDLNVRPRSTEVYVDGEYVGLARNFDGYPGYLWLDEGTYELAFFRDGYETVTRSITIHPDAVIEVRERLERGASVRPEPKARPPEAGEADASKDEAPQGAVTYPRRRGRD